MLPSKKSLWLWVIWFSLANAVLFWIIGLGYLSTIPWFDTSYLYGEARSKLKFFVLITYLGQLGLLALLENALWVPIILFFKRRTIIFLLIAFLSALCASLLIADVFVYRLYRFHLNGVVAHFVVYGLFEEIFGLSGLELASVFLGCGILFILEWLIAIFIWHGRASRFFLHQSKWGILLIFFTLYCSYAAIIYSKEKNAARVYVDATSSLPLYSEILGALLPIKQGQKLLESTSNGFLLQPSQANQPLNYPLQPLQFGLKNQALNLLIIVVDALRFDMFQPAIMPHLTEFGSKSWVFDNHYSGGNSTGPGIFSLFYGLPATYWTSIEKQHQSPLLINEILKRHYQVGIFSSAALRLPPFHKTIFQAIPHLQIEEQPASNVFLRDQMITQKFIQFLSKLNPQQPFFSFLFYNGVHSYCAYEEDLHPLQPTIQFCRRMELTDRSDPLPYENRYKNAVSLVDMQIQHVLDALNAKGLLKNTIVMVTSDHGEEFNDNHQNYWGHASNFTQYQTRTPLIVYWPGKKPTHFSHMTAHYDIAPTLMSELFGCQTKPEKFSLGMGLLESKIRPYLIIGGYNAFGIVDSKCIIHIYRSGSISLQSLNGQISSNTKLDEAIMKAAFQDLRRFYR